MVQIYLYWQSILLQTLWTCNYLIIHRITEYIFLTRGSMCLSKLHNYRTKNVSAILRYKSRHAIKENT